MSLANYQLNGVGFDGTFNAGNYDIIPDLSWNLTTGNVSTVGAGWQYSALSSTGQYGVTCVYNGSIWYSNNFCQKWTVSNAPTKNWMCVSISAKGDKAVACSETSGTIYYSSDYGATWLESNGQATLRNWISISISADGNYALASAKTTNIYKSINSGQNWTALSATTSATSNSISINSNGTLAIFCVYGLRMYRSTDLSTFDTVSTPSLNRNWRYITMSYSGQYGIACILDDTIYYSNDKLVTWTASDAPDASWRNLSMSASGKYCIGVVFGGKLYYSNNYGKNWKELTRVPTGNWQTCALSGSGQYAIACVNNVTTGDFGYIYYYSNPNYYGNVMTEYNIAGTNIGENFLNLQSFSMVAGSITASGYTTKILQYNTGDSWTSAGMTALSWQGCAMSASGQYAVAGINATAGKMYYSSDYGKTWTASTMPSSITGFFYHPSMSASGQYALACGMVDSSGYLGRVYVSSNYGQTWTQVANTTSSLVYIFTTTMSASGQYGLFGNNTGVIYYSFNYGVTWTASTAPSATWLSIANSASGQYAIAGSGASQSIHYSMDYGQTWTASNSGVGYWQSLSMSSSGQYCVGCIATSTGRIYYSSDYGQTWTQSTSAPQANWYSVSISSTGQYALACQNQASGKVYYSIDKGVTWTAMSFATTGTWREVAISKSGQYAIGGIFSSQLYYSSNTSTTTVSKDLADVFEPLYKYKTWIALETTSGVAWSGITCNLDGKYVVATYAGGSGKTIYSSNYGDGNWTEANPAGDMRGVSMSNTGQYVHGVVYSTATAAVVVTNNYSSATWGFAGTNGNYMLSIATSSSGRYVIANRDAGSMLSGATHYSTGFGAAGAWASTTGLSVACHYIALSGNGKYGIACPISTNTSGGNGIYYSSNSGLSWAKSNSLTTTNFNGCAISADGNYAIAGASSSGKIHYSLDYGQTWIASNSASENWKGLSMSESGQYCVAACGNEKIYYSNDYGVNWTSTIATTTAAADATNDIAISKNGQYAFVTTTSGKIWRCLAKNT